MIPVTVHKLPEPIVSKDVCVIDGGCMHSLPCVLHKRYSRLRHQRRRFDTDSKPPVNPVHRKCVGDQFALMEAVVALALALQRYEFRMVPGFDPGMTTGAPTFSGYHPGTASSALVHSCTVRETTTCMQSRCVCSPTSCRPGFRC